VWSFIDSFEFQFGYTARFGLYGVDFKSKEKTRYQRKSAKWYAQLLSGNRLGKNPSDQVVYDE
jgi:beta-glucosidase